MIVLKGLKEMQIECEALPCLPQHKNLDVWKMKHPDRGEGVALTISDNNGTIYAGVHLTKDQWAKLKAVDF